VLKPSLSLVKSKNIIVVRNTIVVSWEQPNS
jgi:hypothetical protein